MTILDQLHTNAQTFARQIQCWRYDSSLAEQDFRYYLKSQPDPDYPPWGARASWTLHCNELKSQSGTGNPLSPLIIVGSEFSADPTAYQELYFKYCFDILWKEVFDIPGCEIVRHRLKSAFIKHWGGAGTEDESAGYAWAPFYKSLRYFLIDQPDLWKDQPFVANHMYWHTGRPGGGGGHQWGIASRFIQWLQKWPEYPSKPTKLSSNGQAGKPFSQNFEDDKIDSFAFFTESSLEAAAIGIGKYRKKTPKFNGFLDHILNNFKQPRIILLNPTPKENLQKELRDKLKESCITFNEWAGNETYPITLWKHINGSWIVFAHTNLTGSAASNEKIADICRLIRKAARRL